MNGTPVEFLSVIVLSRTKAMESFFALNLNLSSAILLSASTCIAEADYLVYVR
jgi:hypothetical protein